MVGEGLGGWWGRDRVDGGGGIGWMVGEGWVGGEGGIGWEGEGLDKDYLLCAVHYW